MKNVYIFMSAILLTIILYSCQQTPNYFPEYINVSSVAFKSNKAQGYANNVPHYKAAAQLHCNRGSFLKDKREAGEQEFGEDGDVDAPFDNIIASEKYEFDLVKNPATGKIPEGIIERSYVQGKLLPAKGIINGRTSNLNTYTPAGPDNLGGRTRAFAYDIRFATNHVMLAGSVSSGVMRSANGGASWTLVTGTNNIHDISCIAQDPRPGQQDTWYLGTGEALGNTSSSDGAFRLGYGVYKSIDNGLSWVRLPGSNAGVYETFDSRRDLISRLVVNPTNGDVYMASIESIYRSADGGASWSLVLGVSTGSASSGDVTDIVCSSTGVLYAALPGTTTQTSAYDGVWTSTTGLAGSWTRISGNGTPSDWKTNGNYGRIVLALAPSKENILYALYDNKATGAAGADFFKYDASTSTWSPNRSSNLPNEGGTTGTFNTQGGYDLAVTVKPDDTSFVVIGGTNAYTSTDAFATATSFKRIGGYASPTTTALYPNHHPDIHVFAFEPGSNMKMVSGDDGGLQATTDVTASSVGWTPLNNGYQTYQYYYAAIDPTAGSDKYIGGAQDNGTTYRTGGSNSMLPILPGDGGSVGISAGNAFHYGALQNGDIIRRLSGANPNTGFNIKPSVLGTAQGLFITLFYLNPDNTEDLYYANANRLFRTAGASTVTASSGWVEMTGVTNAVSGNIRSLATTRGTYDSTHCLYIGTNSAKIFRITNPRNVDATSVPVDITPTGITPGSTVINIAVAPGNDDTVIAVISNYGAVSVFWTGNATTASPIWYNVEGTGNGRLDLPSFRSCAIIKKGSSFEYYVGTSVGLFSTTSIDGTSQATADNTSWTKEGVNVIDQAVVVSLPVRNIDNTMLVATHGNGMFTTTIANVPSPPIATTNAATAITTTSAILNGTVNDNGTTTSVSFDYGTSPTLTGAANIPATIGGSINAGSGNTAVAVTLTGLTPSTTYYFRVKATNSAGTTFGNILSFTTAAILSNNASLTNLTLSTGTLIPLFSTAVTTYTASVANTVTSVDVTATASDASATIKINGASVASGTSKNISLSVGTNTITTVVTAQDGTTKTYTIIITRAAVAIVAPTVTTNAATSVTSTSAILNGTVNDNGASTNVSFDYGTSPTLAGSSNIIATTGATIAAGAGNTAVAVSLAGLTPGTTYYFRAKATNSAGTTNGNILSFTTAIVFSNNGNLTNLSISTGTLSPVFSQGVTAYTASVANNITSVDVTPTASDANATISVNGNAVASGSSKNILLNVGSNTITTVVTAQDGTTKTYTIVITRAAPSSLITDYFRSKQTGNWNDINTWESSSDNVNWTTSTAVPDFNSNIINIRNTHTVTITANVTIDQTIINSGGAIIVNPNVVLTVNDGIGTDVNIANGGNMLLRSTGTGTAIIGSSSGTVSGDVTVERFIGVKSAWRLLTAPLRSTTGANITIFDTWQNKGVNTTGKGTKVTGPNGGNGLDANTFAPSMKWFDGKDFQSVVTTNNPSVTPLITTAQSAANNSYLIFTDGDRNALPGSANSTTLSATGNLQMGDQTFATNATANAFTLIGNPFASPVDLDLFRTSNTSSNLKPTYYYCDPYLAGTYGYGGYVTVSYDGTGSSYTITPSGVDHTRILQSGQAMFVQTSASGTGTGSVIFKEAQKSTTNVNNIFRTSSGKIEGLEINLSTMSSGIPVLVDGIVAKFDDAYSAAVDDYDAGKIYNVGEGVAFVREGKALSIERRPLVKSNDVLYLNLAALIPNKEYRFEITGEFSAPASKAWLKDTYLNTITPINIAGKTVVSFSVNREAASTGANRFSIIFKGEALPQGKPSISLYPNPVNTGIIKVEFKNMRNGIYKIKMLNNLGQVVSVKQVDHVTGNSTEMIQLPKTVSGIYHVEVTRPDNSTFSTKVVIN